MYADLKDVISMGYEVKQYIAKLKEATCPDTYAPPYSAIAAAEAGGVASQAEHKQGVKYAHLDHNHIFTPIAIETPVVFGSD